MTRPPPVLDYARPAAPSRSPSPSPLLREARGMACLAAVPSGVGLALLAGYALTRYGPIAVMGLFWLFVGGLNAFVVFVAALFGLFRVTDYAHDAWAVRRTYAIALLLSAASAPVAYLCVTVGLSLVH